VLSDNDSLEMLNSGHQHSLWNDDVTTI